MVSSGAREGKLHLSENTGSEGRCRAGQRSLHGLKILISRTRRKQDPAPSFVRSGTCFHGNQAGSQETEVGKEGVSEGVFQGPKLRLRRQFVNLSDLRQCGGPERSVSFRPSHSGLPRACRGEDLGTGSALPCCPWRYHQHLAAVVTMMPLGAKEK